MRMRTASQVITFVKQLEGDSAKFYELLAQRHPEGKDVFLAYARENGKNIVQIEQAYYSVISDAIEGGFAFDMEPETYALSTVLPENAPYAEALARAAEIEAVVMRFYGDAVDQSRSLMADVPRAFGIVARRREGRKPKLTLMAASAGKESPV